MKPVFFPTPAEFRGWLDRHPASTSELWVGFHKIVTSKQAATRERWLARAIAASAQGQRL